MLYTARSRYSTYVVNDMDKSATPAVAFSLLVENTGTKATDVDFVFTLPFSVEPESARPEGGPVRKKRLFWRHVILKTMNLPRQARDRHRKSGEKRRFLVGLWCHVGTIGHICDVDGRGMSRTVRRMR